MPRYHPFLVVLHWLVAGLVGGALVIGGVVMSEMPNSDPEKLTLLRTHMIVGIVILLLMVLRVFMRLRSAVPPEADAGHPLLNQLARPAHLALYVLVFGMCASGIALSIQSGLPDAVFGGAPLPDSFAEYTPRAVHGVLATLLGLTIVAHIAAALYHQVIRRDKLFARMWFGR